MNNINFDALHYSRKQIISSAYFINFILKFFFYYISGIIILKSYFFNFFLIVTVL